MEVGSQDPEKMKTNPQVRVYVCMYVCMYVYVCMYILYLCVYLCRCIYVCVHTYIQSYIHTSQAFYSGALHGNERIGPTTLHTYIHTHIHTYTNTYIHHRYFIAVRCMAMRAYTFRHTYIHTYTHIHTSQVFYSGALHGNERIGPTTLVEFATILLGRYHKDAWIR
jgi:hypothetical protein